MKKILMMLLGVAFATCAWATVHTVLDPKAKGVHLVLGSGDPSYEGALGTWSAQSVYWTTTLMEESWSVQLPLVQTYSLAAFTDCGDGSFTYDLDNASYFALVVTYDDANLSPGGSFKAYIVNNLEEEYTFDLSTMTPIATGDFGGVAPVKYMTWDDATKAMVATNTTNYTVVTKDTATFENKKWYVVTNTVERGTIKVNGEAHLILCDGASLTATAVDGEAGINVDSINKSLTIYGQSEGTGALIANADIDGAGIGGSECLPCGTITINGGTITANGSPRGAGIGGGWCAYGGVVTINGGTITANGGTDSAGIGGGWGGRGGTVTINGGKITASSLGGAGIGAGTGPSSTNHGVITFAEGVEFSIVAGDDGASATATTVDDYKANRGAKYVKIEGGDSVTYLTWDENEKKLVEKKKTKFEVVTKDTATFEDGKWYAVTNTIERAGIKVNGEAHLILCDGASLKVKGDANKAGIEVPADKSLTIYGQSEGTGKLEASSAMLGAGIGGSSQGSCGAITINGGTIKATGGAGGAGIGGGMACTSAATITINGGEIEAIGGISSAGIGSGVYNGFSVSRIDTDLITINGGTIKATGGSWAAGIGSGESGFAATVVINGGEITASTEYVDAIGSGFNAKEVATVIFGTAMASKHVWAGASASNGVTMTTAAFATMHRTTYVELPVETYEVAYDANGAAGSMTNSVFAVTKEVTLKKNAFTALGYDFAGWTTNGTDVVYADEAKDTDFATTNATLTLTAKWELDSNGVTATDFTSLTNLITKAGQQASTLPITIDFTSDVAIEGAELPTLPTSTGFNGLKYIGDDEGGSNLYIEDGVLYGDVLRGEVTVDALVLMQHAMGGSVSSFKALSAGETEGSVVTNDVVMLLGNNGKAYFNDTDDVDEMITDILAADPRPTKVKLYEVKGAIVTFEAMGGIIGSGTDPLGNDYDGGVESVTYLCMPDSGYEPPTVARADYELIGWYDGWTNGVNQITNNQEIVNYSKHSLYAKWHSTKIRPSETPGEKIIKTKEGEDGTITRQPVETVHKELILPETDTGDKDGTPLTKIEAKAFAGLDHVTKVALPLYVKEIGERAFYNEANLAEITFVQPRDYDTLDKVQLTIGERAFSGTKITAVTIPSTTASIGKAAFANCKDLREVTILGELTIAGDYPFRNCGSEEDQLTITLSPRAAADQDFIDSLTNGCNNVKINEKYAGEIEIDDFRVETETIEIDFTYSANDVDINVDTVTAVPATFNETVITAKDPMTTLQVRANGSNSYTAVFKKPSGSSLCFRLAVNIEK